MPRLFDPKGYFGRTKYFRSFPVFDLRGILSLDCRLIRVARDCASEIMPYTIIPPQLKSFISNRYDIL
jgi:hypothetical protein